MESSFGTWIKRRRKMLDLTRQELAARVGCSASAIHKIESDERRPSRQIAGLLARHLEIPPEQHQLFIRVARQEKTMDSLEPLPLTIPTGPVSILVQRITGLPVPATSLVGRERELDVLARQLQDPHCRLLTLTGPGGVGKTRLALEFARRRQEQTGGGVYFIALAGVSSPEHIVPTTAASLGLQFSGSLDQKTQILNYLHNKDTLLIFDNLEHLLGDDGRDLSAGFLADLLVQTSKVKIIVTSREQLHLRAEWVLEVQGLPVPRDSQAEDMESNSAIRLFMQRARQARVGFEPGDDERSSVSRICQLVEGLPLGIELAAAWVRSLSCREIAQELEKDPAGLAAFARDLPERHRTLQAVMSHSWELLSIGEREVLSRLSVFRGGFDRRAAEAVAGGTLSLLSALVEKSLLRRTETGRYQLHEYIRQFAREQLRSAGVLEVAAGAHLDYFLALVEETRPKLYGPEQIACLDLLEENQDNLRAALEWSLNRAGATNPDASIRELALLKSLRLVGGLYLFWKRRDHWSEGRGWLERALARSAGSAPSLERLQVLYAAALLAAEQTDTRSARQLAEENFELSQQMGDRRTLAKAHHALGVVLWKQKEHAAARSHCVKALAIFRDLGDHFAISDTLHALGHIAINQDDFETARSSLEESLSIAEENSYALGVDEALGDLGLVDYLQNDYTTARSRLEESLKRFQETGSVPGIESALNRLGDLARSEGDYEKAGRLYAESLALYRGLNDLDEIPSLLHNLGYVAQARGDYPQALALFKEALAIQQGTGNQAGIAECLEGIGAVLAAQGEAEPAVRLLGAAEALRESAGAAIWPANRIEYDRTLERLHTSLDMDALAAAWTRGRKMTVEEAIAEVPAQF